MYSDTGTEYGPPNGGARYLLNKKIKYNFKITIISIIIYYKYIVIFE